MKSFITRCIVLAGVISGVLCPCRQAPGQTNELAEMRASYRNGLAKVEDNHLVSLMNLQGDYTNRLNAMETAMTARGNLEGVLAVRAEKSRFAESKTAPERAVARKPAELKALQEEYIAITARLALAAKREAARISQAYVARLEELQKNFTKSNRIEDALVSANSFHGHVCVVVVVV